MTERRSLFVKPVILHVVYVDFAADHDPFQSLCPGHALAPFALKNSTWRKEIQMDGPESAPNFSNQKMTKSNFRNVVWHFSPVQF